MAELAGAQSRWPGRGSPARRRGARPTTGRAPHDRRAELTANLPGPACSIPGSSQHAPQKPKSMAREATNAWTGAAPAAWARLAAHHSTRAQGGGLVPNGVGESQEVALGLHFAFSPPPKCSAVWAHLLARPGARPCGSGAQRSSRARLGQGTASRRPSRARHVEARYAGEGGPDRHVLLRDAPSSCHVASTWASSASARAALAGLAVLLRAYNLRRKKVLGR
jgi:hypothetical protein